MDGEVSSTSMSVFSPPLVVTGKHKRLKHFRTTWGAQLSLQPIAQDLCANGSGGRSAEFLAGPLRWTKLSYAECGAEFPQHICTFYKKHLGLHVLQASLYRFSKNYVARINSKHCSYLLITQTQKNWMCHFSWQRLDKCSNMCVLGNLLMRSLTWSVMGLY